MDAFEATVLLAILLGLFGACVKAEAATDFAAALDRGFLRILDACVATALLVCSLCILAID